MLFSRYHTAQDIGKGPANVRRYEIDQKIYSQRASYCGAVSDIGLFAVEAKIEKVQKSELLGFSYEVGSVP